MRTLHFIGASTLALALGAAAACSSSTNSGSTGTGGESSTSSSSGAGASGSTTSSATTGSTTASSTTGTGGTGGGTTTGTGGSGGCGGATPVTLTVKNILAWCDVTVDGNPASGLSSQTVCVASGKKVDLTAVAHTGFKLGNTPWHDTDGDTGSGEKGTVTGTTSAATVTVTGTADCAWVCCEFTAGGGCPTTDQCP